jgi:hypothetical protein
MAADVRTILLACDEGLFLTVTPILRKKRLIIEVSALTPSLGQKAIAESLKRDVRFLGPRCLEKVPVRHELGGAMAAVSDRLSGAMAFKALQPLDGYRFAHLIMTRRRPAAQLAPLHRVDHPVAQILRIRLCHLLLASAQPAG